MKGPGWFVAAAAALALAATAVSGFAGDETTPPATATTNVVRHQTLCPVMGGEVNKKLFVDYEGKRIYVCCRDCLKAVKLDPAKYVKQLEADGITLDKAEPAKGKHATHTEGVTGATRRQH
jgi:YHS domain-containing protein